MKRFLSLHQFQHPVKTWATPYFVYSSACSRVHLNPLSPFNRGRPYPKQEPFNCSDRSTRENKKTSGKHSDLGVYGCRLSNISDKITHYKLFPSIFQLNQTPLLKRENNVLIRCISAGNIATTTILLYFDLRMCGYFLNMALATL